MYLVLKRDKNVDSEELVDLFWPESSLERGKKRLYDTIYLLRKSLDRDGLSKDIVESSNGYYSINSDYKVWTDWDHFDSKTDQLLKEDKEFSLKDLKTLFEFYRGDFFNELNYADWTEIYREELRQKYLDLIELMTAKMYESKKYLDALNYLNRGLDYDPYREKFYLLKIKTLGKLNRIAEAISCFEDCKNILEEELGVSPQRELKNELQRIKNSRDFNHQDIELNISRNVSFESGAMRCSTAGELKRVFELELRQVRRMEDKEFLLVTLNFEEDNFKAGNVKFTSDQIAERFKSSMRMGDYICPINNKIHIILQGMSLDSSGAIIKRFNQFFKQLNFARKPKLDIKEID